MKPSDFVKCEILEENLTDEPLYNDYEEVIIPQNPQDFKLESQDIVDIKEEVLEKYVEYENLEENTSRPRSENINLKELKSENVIEKNEDFRLSASLPRVRSCYCSTFIRYNPILIWSFSKESVI